jgi:EAL and modified HD-GYP domain-containing signal transduction protein
MSVEGTADDSAWIGRSPVYDTRRVIHAFELHADKPDNIRDALGKTDASTLTDDLPVFLSSPEVVWGHIPAQHVIAIIPPSIPCPGDVERFRRMGYRIAVHEQDAGKLCHTDYALIDIRSRDGAQLRHAVSGLHGAVEHVVATHVGSDAQLQCASQAGANLFNGGFLRDSVRKACKSVPCSRIAALRIVAQCQTPNITVQELAETISADAALAFGLLRLANTLLYSRPEPVETLGQAVRRLGTQTVMRWTILLTMASQQDCPPGYLRLALERAHMCERLAKGSKSNPETAFLAGLLSLLDSIMQLPLTAVMRQISVAPEIVAAVTSNAGEVGSILGAVRGWENAISVPHSAQLAEAWLHALHASRQTFRSLLEVTDHGVSNFPENN